jgi:hypothetical protein
MTSPCCSPAPQPRRLTDPFKRRETDRGGSVVTLSLAAGRRCREPGGISGHKIWLKLHRLLAVQGGALHTIAALPGSTQLEVSGW